MATTTSVTPVRWRDGLELLDQRLLPGRVVWLRVASAAAAARLITGLAVRGAPAIGITAAYALAAEARQGPGLAGLRRAAGRLAAARPTAVNLAWAVDEVMREVSAAPEAQHPEVALAVARRLHEEDAAACLAMARHGADLFGGRRVSILTHCNAGALATGGIGTALGVVRELHARGQLERLYADETRPVLQGARLTAWEAVADGIPVTLLADGAAASLLAAGRVDGVVVGSDRIAADGSVANKIGTYPLAVLAARHEVPMVVAAPTSTFDLQCSSGAEIPIEQRSALEVARIGRRHIAAAGVDVFNPAFDVTPPDLVTAIVSERGAARPVNRDTVRRVAR